MEREIPGYYYDREKKKYFKILPNHVALRGTQYTKENVERIKENEKKRKREEEQQRRLQGRIQRSRILTHPLAAVCCLNRETGLYSLGKEQRAKAYAQGLERSTTLSTGESAELQHFARDEATGALVIGGPGHLRYVPLSKDDDGSVMYSRHRIKNLSAFASKLTSINIGPTRTLVSTTLGDVDKASIWLTKLVEPSQFDGTMLDVGIHTILRPCEEAVWTSAPSKVDGTIAVGTSTGILIFTEVGSNWTERRALNSNSDVFALEYLSPSTMAAGLRNNNIQLYDQRSSGKALRLRHPSSVTGIKQVDDWKVVVCGLRDSMRMYDLRFHPGPKTKRASQEATVPVLVYPYSNSFRPDLGFDVDIETRLVAAGSEHKGLQLFSLDSGEEIMPKAPSRTFPDLVKCIQFSQGPNQAYQPKELLVSAESSVECFSW